MLRYQNPPPWPPPRPSGGPGPATSPATPSGRRGRPRPATAGALHCQSHKQTRLTAGRGRGWGWQRSSAGGTGGPSHCCSLQARPGTLQGAVLPPRAAHRRNTATGSVQHTLQCCTVLQGGLGAGRGRGPGAQFRWPGHAPALQHSGQFTQSGLLLQGLTAICLGYK